MRDFVRVAQNVLTEEKVLAWKTKLAELKNSGASIEVDPDFGRIFYYNDGIIDEETKLNKLYIDSIKSYDEIPKSWEVPLDRKCDGAYMIDARTASKKFRIICNTKTPFTHIIILS